MKKLIPLSLIACLLLAMVSNVQAQTAENPWGFTFRFGFASYNGDLGNSMLELTNEQEGEGTNGMYGIGISYFINDAWAFAVNANYMSLEKANPPTDNVFAQRNTSFAANIVNANALLRWNFINTFIDGRDSNLNPYITAGVAGNFLHHSSSTDVIGNTIAPDDADEIFVSIPFGAGVNYAITDAIIFNLQILYNRTFTDRIDLFPIANEDTKAGFGTPDIDGIDHDDYLQTTIGATFAFGGDPADEMTMEERLLQESNESLNNIEEDVDEINDKMDELIELNQESLDALNELQEDQGLSDQQMRELRGRFVRIVNNIQFAFDESYIIEPAMDELESLANVMQEYQNLDIHVEAYADERGSTEYNNELAQRRAQSVKDFLTERGVNPARITTDIYGETEEVLEQGITQADMPTVWAQNRAVQITLSYDG